LDLISGKGNKNHHNRNSSLIYLLAIAPLRLCTIAPFLTTELHCGFHGVTLFWILINLR
jgi:hypothetical protein